MDATVPPEPEEDSGTSGDAGPGVVECRVPPSADPFANPAREFRWRGEGLPFPEHEHTIVSPVVIDLIEDGPDESFPEIIFVSYDGARRRGVLRVISGRPPYETLMTLAGDGTGPVTDDSMATPSVRFDGHPAAGDLDGDGRPEVIAALDSGGAIAWRYDGSIYWMADFPVGERGANGSFSIADLDHDGMPEVVIGRVVLDGQTGATRWTGTGGKGLNNQGVLSCVADLDETPAMEIIAGNTVYTSSGEIVWQAAGGTGDGFCAIADITLADGTAGRDGTPEVVRVAASNVYVHDGPSGELRWSRSLPSCSGSRGRGGAPTVADFDGDGVMEIGVAGANCYAVFDVACAAEPRPEGCMDDSVLWTQATEDDSSSVTSSTVFDFNGDGRAEVVYNDEEHFLVFDGLTGEVIFRDENPSRTRTEQPIVVDVDNDGNAEIIFSANAETSFAGNSIAREERVPGLEIWSSADDSWVGARPIWNQHTYHITNVETDGRIPVTETKSWETHNSYRLNASENDALLAPDLTADASAFDQSRCGESILIVCAQVYNRGEALVGPGLAVTFYDGDPDMGGAEIASTTTTRSLDPGTPGERVCVNWNPAPTDEREVWVRVDSEDSERECIEDNNTVNVGSGRCVGLD
jgi:hypothetical protein